MSKSSRILWAQHLAGQSKKSTNMDAKILLRKVPFEGRILGIDPSLRGTGLAVLECKANSYQLLHSQTLVLKPKIDSISCLSAPAIREVPVFEYAPLRVKQAVVGFGRASKEQMSQTLSQMLNLPSPLPFDQSDALGLALCHALTWHPG